MNPLTVLSLIIDGSFISNFSIIIENSTVLTITNAILTDSFINTVIVSLGNVLNPSPAMTTGTFTVLIGSDYSSIGGSSNSIMTLSADTFINCGISF